MQRRIGLTGGIASGKSSVGRLLEARGWPVLDADHYARNALAPNTAASQAVAQRFGATVGSAADLDRKALGRIVFSDPDERRWLEALIHPVVRERFQHELAELKTEPVVVLMIPLLFETGLEALCSEIWLVDCEPHQQLERLMRRSGLNEADAQARLAAQWPLSRKRPLADRVIDNRGTADALATAVNRCDPASP
jgi:dephospho-CoA kinase